MAGRKTFTAGEVLQAADVNDFLMDQSVMVFAGTAARGSAIPSPTEGMVTYLQDADELQVYTTAWGGVAGGKILQVVSAVYSTAFSTSSTSYVDTGLTANITPTDASSKILVMVTQSGTLQDSSSTGAAEGFNSIERGGSTLVQTKSVILTRASATAELAPFPGSLTYLDSPATTSSITYKTQAKVGGTGILFFQTDSVADSIITLIEVAG